MRRKTTVPLAALGLVGLVVLSGCAGSEADTSTQDAGASVEPDAKTRVSKADAQRQQMERLIADCMKKEGFQYLPDLRPMDGGDDQPLRFGGPASVLEPADKVRVFRQKYGFGAFARLVYPNDPVLARQTFDPSQPGPNAAIVDAMEPSKRKAYELALHGTDDGLGSKAGDGDQPGGGVPGCAGAAAEKVYPAGKNTGGDAQAANQRAYQKFQNDPAVVAAAQTYADCLRVKGYKAKSTRPGEIDTSLYDQANDAVARVNPASQAPDSADAKPVGSSPITAEVAKAELDKEIKAALADLDCRGDYAKIARTKYADAVADGGGAG